MPNVTKPNVPKAEVEASAVTRFRINPGQSHFTAHVSVGGLLKDEMKLVFDVVANKY